MQKHEKLIRKILSASSDANIQFEDLRSLLEYLGFEMRVRGSHHIFRKEGIIKKINIQREGNKAKPYQVKQVRNVILEYKLGGTLDV